MVLREINVATEATIKDALQRALAKCGSEAQSIFVPPENSRRYGCRVAGCTRPAYATKLCNGHYLRARAGKPLSPPLRARKREGKCAECGVNCGTKGGWGLCNRHYRFKRYAAMKDAVIAAMGGKCARCGGAFHRSVFDFHHRSGKTDAPSSLLVNASAEEAARELAKCNLLCANCHRLEHWHELRGGI